MPAPRHTVIVLCGPTASGKSALALRVAKAGFGVLINADSMQVYGSIPTLTAAPSEAEMAQAPHRLFGYLDPSENGDVAAWANAAASNIRDTWQEGNLPIVVGGTGMYIKALLEGISEIPDVPDAVRTAIRKRHEEQGLAGIYGELKQRDPEVAESLEAGDTQRILRAFEVLEATGKSIRHWQRQPATPPLPEATFETYVLSLDRELLYARCNQRLEQMIEGGALEELQALLDRNLSTELPCMRAVGVPELTKHLRGEWSLDEAIEKAQQATRNYAKRQLTWLRNQLPEATRIAYPYDDLPEALQTHMVRNS